MSFSFTVSFSFNMSFSFTNWFRFFSTRTTNPSPEPLHNDIMSFSFTDWLEVFYAETQQPSPEPLPDDIMWDIFWRLPVKELMRLKCLSTFWKAWIPASAKYQLCKSLEDPTMRDHYLFLSIPSPLNQQNRRVFLSYSIWNYFNGQGPFRCTREISPFRLDNYAVLGSVHCFICFISEKKMGQTYVLLWNPWTREVSNESPRMDLQLRHGQGLPERAKRQQRKSQGILQFGGFGYDGLNQSYKAVVIVLCRSAKKNLRVLAIGNDHWISYDNLNFLGQPFDEHLPSFVAGKSTLNWLAKGSSSTLIIVTCNLTTDTVGNVEVPPHLAAVDRTVLRTPLLKPKIGVLQDHLSLFYTHEESHTVQIWMMKRYGVTESWAHMMSIPYVEDTPLKPIAISEEGEVAGRYRGIRVAIDDPGTGNRRILAPVQFAHPYNDQQHHAALHEHHSCFKGIVSPHF